METTKNIDNMIPKHEELGRFPKNVVLIGYFFILTNAIIPFAYAKVDLSLRSSVEYDSEIRSRNEGWDDIRFEVETIIQTHVRLRKMEISTRLGAQILRFEEHNDLGTEGIIARLEFVPSNSFRNNHISLSGNLSLDRSTTSDPILGDLITSDRLSARGQLLYDPTRRRQYTLEPYFNKLVPDLGNYRDLTLTGVKLRSQQRFSNRSAIIAEAHFNTSQLSGSNPTQTDFYSIQTGWEHKENDTLYFLLSVGLQAYDRESSVSSENPYARFEATWSIDDTTRLTASATHSLEVHLENSINEKSLLEIICSRQINHRLKALLRGALGKDRLENPGQLKNPALFARSDDFLQTSFELQVLLARESTLRVFIGYTDRSSNITIFTYDRLQAGTSVQMFW
jgi:hypothetical protein